ncbi:MAG: response regulator transcription factor [Caldilineaceae bacterium]|nr:response regulator transcription factor [Caldilineaceae bacterium]
MVRVFMVHEHRLVGDLIACALREREEFSVVRNINDINHVIEHLQQTVIDVILISMALPDSAALPLVRAISEEFTEVKVLVTNLIRSKSAIVQCLEEGAAGYVLEDESLADLARKICEVRENRFQIPPDITMALVSRMAELKRLATTLGTTNDIHIENNFNELTPREHEVLNLLAKGQSNQEIATNLVIEVGTVKNHVHNIFRKLDIHERQHAAAIAQYIL